MAWPVIGGEEVKMRSVILNFEQMAGAIDMQTGQHRQFVDTLDSYILYYSEEKGVPEASIAVRVDREDHGYKTHQVKIRPWAELEEGEQMFFVDTFAKDLMRKEGSEPFDRKEAAVRYEASPYLDKLKVGLYAFYDRDHFVQIFNTPLTELVSTFLYRLVEGKKTQGYCSIDCQPPTDGRTGFDYVLRAYGKTARIPHKTDSAFDFTAAIESLN